MPDSGVLPQMTDWSWRQTGLKRRLVACLGEEVADVALVGSELDPEKTGLQERLFSKRDRSQRKTSLDNRLV